MVLSQILLLFAAATVAGAVNSVAGGGTFFSFPALLAAGVPAVPANATNAVALWPGSAASVWAYRRELGTQGQNLVLFSIISVVGGIIGGALLLITSNETFEVLLPYLLLFATLIFTFSGPVTRRLRAGRPEHAKPSPLRVLGVPLLQLATAIYGGFFGGGIGILMLATLAIMGMENIHEMNSIKTLLATLINGSAVVLFVLGGAVFWPEALIMIVGATVGGYVGAAVARHIEPRLVRSFVIICGFALSLYYFIWG
jgi:uncharacterized membrane protein YfcA